MAIVTEFEVGPGDKISIKLIPVDNVGGGANIENVDFQSDSGDVVLTVDINNPLLFFGDVAVFESESDVNLVLHADGKIGEGVSEIDKTLILHLRSRAAVDVKFDVQVITAGPVEPPPAPDPA